MSTNKIIQPTEATSRQPYDASTRLYINEIFYSIQGEGLRAGVPCVFVRLQGCTLRCVWCDTKYALDHKTGGEWMTLGEIVERVKSYPCQFVEFSGGEPLEQESIYPLMTELCNQGYTVAIETGGHVDTRFVDERVIRIIDIKCPDSRMQSLNQEQIAHLRPHDELKFVIASDRDYEFARDLVRSSGCVSRCAAVLFSPAFGLMDAQRLAERILEDNLGVRMQIQLHKFIWHPETRGV